jgi:hypothetical protein
MTDELDLVYESIDRTHAGESASTRRRFVAQTAATLGGLGLLGGLPSLAKADGGYGDDPQVILNVAATAEVLATIVNTVGWQRGLGGDAVTQRNVATAAREELIHYQTLKSLGASELTQRIWVPDAVFANRTNFLNTLQVGDQIFVNAYLVGTRVFSAAGNIDAAVYAAEIMGVEAVHRALARQSLGLLGNDRAFMKLSQKEEAPGAPNQGEPGFHHIGGAVRQLREAGFNFGKEGATPGAFYDFAIVSAQTPEDPDVNTRKPVAS